MTTETAALRRALAAADAMAEAVETLRREMENPVPDAVYRGLLRRQVFEKAAAYLAARKEAR